VKFAPSLAGGERVSGKGSVALAHISAITAATASFADG
jgi:hypothetical protein